MPQYTMIKIVFLVFPYGLYFLIFDICMHCSSVDASQESCLDAVENIAH